MNNVFTLKELNKDNIKEIFNYDVSWANKLEELLNKELLAKLDLKYALIYNYDSVITDKIENVEIDLENIMEARFFNEEKEIRIFNEEGEFYGTIFRDRKEQEPIEETYILYPRNKEQKVFPSKLKVKKYINYDENDGQAYIDYIKPCEFIF